MSEQENISRQMKEHCGPALRTDVVDVYIFRRREPAAADHPGQVEFLQLHRVGRRMGSGLWQPVMGHVEAGETAVAAALRELHEETGLTGSSILHFRQLEQVHPFYLSETNEIVLSPRFACEVSAQWEPVLNTEHDDYRWVPRSDAAQHFVWPGQRLALKELCEVVLDESVPGAGLLEIDLETMG